MVFESDIQDMDCMKIITIRKVIALKIAFNLVRIGHMMQPINFDIDLGRNDRYVHMLVAIRMFPYCWNTTRYQCIK